MRSTGRSPPSSGFGFRRVTGLRTPSMAPGSSGGPLDLAAGADPVAAARLLAQLHTRWVGRAHLRWPWLRRVARPARWSPTLYDHVWPNVALRADLTAGVRELGHRLVGRVIGVESAVARAGPLTLAHGDASLRNMRTGPDGEIALLDWEDVSAVPAALDLAWLLVSSVDPERWDHVIAAYGSAGGLPRCPRSWSKAFLAWPTRPRARPVHWPGSVAWPGPGAPIGSAA